MFNQKKEAGRTYTNFCFYKAQNKENTIQKNDNFEILCNDNIKGLFNSIAGLENSAFTINSNDSNSMEFEIALYLDNNKREEIHFKLIFYSNQNYFDYIPVKLDFPLEENQMKQYGEPLEIYQDDITKFLNQFLQIRGKYKE